MRFQSRKDLLEEFRRIGELRANPQGFEDYIEVVTAEVLFLAKRLELLHLLFVSERFESAVVFHDFQLLSTAHMIYT